MAIDEENQSLGKKVSQLPGWSSSLIGKRNIFVTNQKHGI